LSADGNEPKPFKPIPQLLATSMGRCSLLILIMFIYLFNCLLLLLARQYSSELGFALVRESFQKLSAKLQSFFHNPAIFFTFFISHYHFVDFSIKLYRF